MFRVNAGKVTSIHRRFVFTFCLNNWHKLKRKVNKVKLVNPSKSLQTGYLEKCDRILSYTLRHFISRSNNKTWNMNYLILDSKQNVKGLQIPKNWWALARYLSWLEHHPNILRLKFDPWSGHIQDSTNECINKWNNKSMFLSLSPLSL